MNKVFWLVVAVCAMGLMMACKNGTVAEGKVLDSLIANHGVVGTFHEGLAYVKIDGKIGYVDTTGKLVISPQFESEKYGFHDGMAVVEQGSKYGWIDKKGNFVIEPEYDDVGLFHEGFAWVRVGEKIGFVDKQGNLLTPAKWDMATDFFEKGFESCYALVELDGKTYRIDTCGNTTETNEKIDWSGEEYD